jgi:hypothetical protein
MKEKDKEIAEVIKFIAEMEVMDRVIRGELPVDRLTNQDFIHGVCVGITLATDRILRSIPNEIKPLIREAIIARSKQGEN